MYKIFFENRYIALLPIEQINKNSTDKTNIICKNIKTFDNAYSDFIGNYGIKKLNAYHSNPKKLFRYFKKRFKVIKAAGGLVSNFDGKTLLIKRNNMWDLPKGKIEKNEKKKAAALREVTEECGIQELEIKNRLGNTYHTYLIENQMVLKITYWYNMLYKGTEQSVPQKEEGITETRWIRHDELNEFIDLVYPNLRSVLKTRL